jgi:hypothetical protein
MSKSTASPAKPMTIYALTESDTGEVRSLGLPKKVWKGYGRHACRI